MKKIIKRRLRKITAGALMLSAKTGLSGNQALHPVRTVSYALSWPADFDLSVALLSDIHMGVGMNMRRLNEIVAAVNALKCDVVAVLGDMVDGTQAASNKPEHDWSQALAALRAPVGVAGVAGNHDYKGDITRVRRLFSDAGIPMLNNTALHVDKDGNRFWLAGLDSQWGAPVPAGHVRKGHHDIDKTLAAITNDDPVILLMHEPDIFDSLPNRFPISFAGHTHGGQIHLPFIGRPIVRAFPGHFRSDKIYGHFVSPDGARQMVVTAGVGCSGLPLRWGVPPEIVKVELKGRRSGDRGGT